jgi:thioesterase III
MKTNITVTIRSFHTDCFGHVHHGRYVELLEEGRWAYMENNPSIAASLHREGIDHAVVHLEISYRGEARLGDRLQVETEVHRAGCHGITLRQVMVNKRTGMQVLSADVTNVFYRGMLGNKVPAGDPAFECWEDLQNVIKSTDKEDDK